MNYKKSYITDYASNPRVGCKDIWNAFMVKNASFSNHDIPYCPTYLPNGLPKKLISYEKAKQLYSLNRKSGNTHFKSDSFIHFCIDDQKFDNASNGIWAKPYNALDIIKHFAGIITPDFSTYADFPDPLKRYNTYRMRAFGHWCYTQGIPVINNVRWGTSETWEYCFDGIPTHSILFIGTVASGIKKIINRQLFVMGLTELIDRLHPKVIILYGSSNYDFINALSKRGITILSFQSETNIAFQRRDDNE